MIYLLTRTGRFNYDEYDSRVVRAKDESEAREIANRHVAGEGQIWNDYELVSCTQVSDSGVSDVILNSYIAG